MAEKIDSRRYLVGGAIIAGISGLAAWLFLFGGKDWLTSKFAGTQGGAGGGTGKNYKVVVGSQPGDTVVLAGTTSAAPQGIACFEARVGEHPLTVTDSTGRTYYRGTVQVTTDTKVNILDLPHQPPQVSVFAIPPGEFDPFKPFCGG